MIVFPQSPDITYVCVFVNFDPIVMTLDFNQGTKTTTAKLPATNADVSIIDITSVKFARGNDKKSCYT